MSARRVTLSVFGLGYVGCVSAACFASRGHDVVGVDVDPAKLDRIRGGSAPIIEDRIEELTREGVVSGRLTVTSDAQAAVLASEVSIVCVGTPSAPGGGLETSFLERVAQEIGKALSTKDGWHTVVFRSSMLPGTCEELLIPLLEGASDKLVGRDFGVCVNPEFLREGTSVADFFDPPKTVVGTSDVRSGEIVRGLYEGMPGPVLMVALGVAEMAKYVDNCFHALKIDFANEIGAICSAVSLDSHAVMDVFLADEKLNLSRAYLRPGFAFGGSCLPKDVRALTHTARAHNVEVPVLSNVLASNDVHLRRALDLIVGLGKRKVGLLGLAFKAGTDDLRESPMVELAERLIGKGCDLRIYDPNVAMSTLVRSNRAYVNERLPHLADVLTDDVEAVVAHGDVVVAGTREPAVLAALDRIGDGSFVVDLVRLPDAQLRTKQGGYVGVSW